MEKSSIIRIHPSFRIIALAEPPGSIIKLFGKNKNIQKIIKPF